MKWQQKKEASTASKEPLCLAAPDCLTFRLEIEKH